MSVTWKDGQKSEGEVEIVPGGFNWDTGMFLPVKAFSDPKQILGKYEGGTSLSFSGNTSTVVKTLTLRADGTFTWEGIASFNTDGTLTGGENATSGKWALNGYLLILTDANGKVVRSIIFPWDDEKTAISPDHMFFAGTMYKKHE